MAHPDEVVKEVQDVEEVPSKLIAEAQLRHDEAKTDRATDQEKKQAAVEEAHALSTRPDGSYAQLHETDNPTLAVADEGEKKQLEKQRDEAVESLEGGPSPAEKDSEKAGDRAPSVSGAESRPAAKTAAAEKRS
jgi:hypothetical protein